MNAKTSTLSLPPRFSVARAGACYVVNDGAREALVLSRCADGRVWAEAVEDRYQGIADAIADSDLPFDSIVVAKTEAGK